MPTEVKKKIGFALLDPKKQLELARRGAATAHANGNAHRFTKEEAREAGKKGGRVVSADKEWMSKIGSLGGKATQSKRAGSDE